jgi:putative ABC transport system substrate-binding protein
MSICAAGAGARVCRAVLAAAVILAHLAPPPGADAQPPPRVFRIGVLGGTSPEVSPVLREFVQRLRELGYAEGRNLIIEGRYYGDRVDRLPALASELVPLRVDVIVAGAVPAPEAAREATSTIPIVMAAPHPDPVGSGLVASLARPGGNVTGLSGVGLEFRGKQLELLKETLPGVRRVAVLSDPGNPFHPRELREVQAAAETLKLGVRVVEARAPDGFVEAVAAATRERAGALVVLGGSMFFTHRARLAELAARSRLPVMSISRESVEAGGLLAYGIDLRASFRRAAEYVDQILRGARPADLPVEQPTKFELVVNLKTAKALGLAIPRSVLARVDEIIE